MTFHVGQKVVCVPSGKPKSAGVSHLRPGPIKVGEVYTIRDIDVRAVEYHGEPTIRLVERVAPTFMTTVGLWEIGYWASCFRPIIERKTSIEIFQQIRRDVEKKIVERV